MLTGALVLFYTFILLFKLLSYFQYLINAVRSQAHDYFWAGVVEVELEKWTEWPWFQFYLFNSFFVRLVFDKLFSITSILAGWCGGMQGNCQSLEMAFKE